MAVKHIVFFGNCANTSGQTLSEPTASSTTGAPSWSTDKSEYSNMDVLINLKTFSGTSITFSIQERISDVGFVETGKTAALTSTGKYFLANGGQTGQSTAANISYGFSEMGRGTDKQVVTTANTVASLSADIYLIFFR